MKIRLITALIAGICASSASFSQDKPLDIAKSDKWEVVGNKLISSEDLKTELSSDFNVQSIILSEEGMGGNATGLAMGNKVVGVYRDRGFVSVDARVNVENKTITVIEGTVNGTGQYGEYFAQNSVLSKDELELTAKRISETAKLNGEEIGIQIRAVDPQTGNAEVRTTAKKIDDAKRYGASVVLSNVGQRYSGPDVGTAYGWANIGNGQQIDLSVAHGFSNARSESWGGKYESGAASYRKSTQYGMTSAQLATTHYRVGGDFAALDINGEVNRLTLEQNYLATKDISLVGRLFRTQNKQAFGMTGWTDSQAYTSISGGVKHQGGNYALDATLEKGLGGSRSVSDVPLLGLFNPHYASLVVNGSYDYAIGTSGWTVQGKGGFQRSSKETPSGAQFAMGGNDRGRSYNTGYAAVPKGAYVGATVYAPTYKNMKFYAGVDGSTGTPAVGDGRKAASAFIGAKFMALKNLSGDVAIAKTLGTNDDFNSRTTKLNLTLTASF